MREDQASRRHRRRGCRAPSFSVSFTIGRTSRAVETGFVERPVAEECLRADRPFDVKAVLPLTQKSLLAVSNRPSIALRGGGDPPGPVAVGKRPLAGVACDYTYRS